MPTLTAKLMGKEFLVCICARCENLWIAKEGMPKRCGRCKSPYWDVSTARQSGVSGLVPMSGTPAKEVGGPNEVSANSHRQVVEKLRAENKEVPMPVECVAAVHPRELVEHHPQCKCGVCAGKKVR